MANRPFLLRHTYYPCLFGGGQGKAGHDVNYNHLTEREYHIIHLLLDPPHQEPTRYSSLHISTLPQSFSFSSVGLQFLGRRDDRYRYFPNAFCCSSSRYLLSSTLDTLHVLL